MKGFSRRTPDHLRVAGSCMLVVTLALLSGVSFVPAASTDVGSHADLRTEDPTAPGTLGQSVLGILLPLERGPGTLGNDGQGLEHAATFPLAFKDYYRLPPWSGLARFGFGVATNPVEEYDVSPLGADWYVAYPGFRPVPPPLFDLEFVQIIRLSDRFNPPSQETVERYAKTQPGTLWLIGNEPDAPAQDCVVPAEYARLYHDWYDVIKAADPCAKVAIGGVVQATPIRLQYLDMVLQAYEDLYGEMIPVDVWNVHGFILQEKAYQWGCQIPCGIEAQQGELYRIQDHDNMTIFREQITRFRGWMADHGQRDKPLIVSEYGILMPIDLGFDEPRVEAFMLATFDYFRTATSTTTGYPADGNKLVQAWAWYSLDDKNFEGYESYGHLFDPDTRQITPLGIAYGNYAASH